MEVASRELEGRLLLGLVAAERGHDVLVGDLRTLLSHRHWLPPGVFHDKALVPSAQRMRYRDALVERGFLLTSQDEEHGLIEPDFARWAQNRFSERSLLQASRVFAWGPSDAAGLRRLFPAAADLVLETGSPRVDIWRPELSPQFDDALPAGVEPGYVFVPSNYGVGQVNPWWDQLADLRISHYRNDDDPAEWEFYAHNARNIIAAGRLVRAIRSAARELPDTRFVVRPHPTETVDAWRALVGPVPNISVIQAGTVSGWIRHARVVVHHSSTTGIEAAVSEVPVVSFRPEEDRGALNVDRIGPSVEDLDSLLEHIRRSGDAKEREGWYSTADRAALDGLLAALDGPLASDRIVDAWEALPHGAVHGRRVRAGRSLLAAGLHRDVGRARTRLRSMRAGGRSGADRTFDVAHKFPALRRGLVPSLVEGYRRTLHRFDDVDVHQVGPRLVHLRPRARRGFSRR
jgi:surface carbohydrate biosynthesis protein